jgi:uncharacterized protein YuzE
MTLPRVTFDQQTEYAYIYLTEPYLGIAKTSVPLVPTEDDQPDGLRSLVLDFDSDGKLVGIEVSGPASHVLRDDLLAAAVRR